MSASNYKIDTDSGLLSPARYVASPNCDVRPDINDINLLVIHNISLPPGEFGGGAIDALFTNQLNPQDHPYFTEIYQLKVSSHLLIRRDGQVTQYVPFQKRAWHAGQSEYCHRSNCNDYSIGIELEGTDDLPYEQDQYDTLVVITKLLLSNYQGLNRERIVGHCDIAPQRKTDPGPAFDWSYYRQQLHK